MYSCAIAIILVVIVAALIWWKTKPPKHAQPHSEVRSQYLTSEQIKRGKHDRSN